MKILDERENFTGTCDIYTGNCKNPVVLLMQLVGEWNTFFSVLAFKNKPEIFFHWHCFETYGITQNTINTNEHWVFPSFLLNFYFKMVKKVAVGKNKGLTAWFWEEHLQCAYLTTPCQCSSIHDPKLPLLIWTLDLTWAMSNNFLTGFFWQGQKDSRRQQEAHFHLRTDQTIWSQFFKR